MLVFAPASVVPVWPKEFDEYADFPYQVVPLEGPGAKRKKTLAALRPDASRMQVVVTNYEASWRLLPELVAWRPDMVICDESQRIKAPGSQQSKAVRKIGSVAKFRLILTGTPVSNSPLDFWAQYAFLDPTIFGTSFYPFRAKYAIMGGYQNHQVLGYRNLPELVKKAHSIAFRVTKDEALDLPEFTDQSLYCELEPDTMRAYKSMVKDSVAEISASSEITAANVLSRLLRLSQMAGGFVNDEDGKVHKVSSAKLNLLDECLDDLLAVEGKKVVIFARFIPEMAAIEELVKGKGVGYCRIAGDVQMAQRGEEVKRFQTDPAARVFIAQIASAGLGITLTAADTAIFYSLDYSFANYDQCRCRTHRLGQKNKCTYIHLVAVGTVDTKVMAALKEKRSVATQVVDDWRKWIE